MYTVKLYLGGLINMLRSMALDCKYLGKIRIRFYLYSCFNSLD